MISARAISIRLVRPASFVLAALLLLGSAGALSAQETDKPHDETLQTGDRMGIRITYYKSPQGQDSPVVVLLHGKQGNRKLWEPFAGELQRAGFAAIAVDLRGHGESTGGPGAPGAAAGAKPAAPRPRDYQLMVTEDLDAVKKFIFEEHQKQNLNMNKMAIVAPEWTAPIAIAYADHDWSKAPYDDAPTAAARNPRGQDVRALILLSPEGNLPGVVATKFIPRIRNPAYGISALIISSEKDSQDKGESKKLYQQLTAITGNDARMFHKEYPGALRGTDLVNRAVARNLAQDVEKFMLFFLDKHVKQAPGSWRDRRSRLSR